MIKIASLIMGSRLYGLEQPDSDIDEFNIYVESFDELLRNEPAPPRDHSEQSDVTSYTLREISNAIERGQIGFYSMLWVPEKNVIHTSPTWKYLVSRRKEFLSREISSFTLGTSSILLGRDPKSAAHGLRILYSLFELTNHERITFPSPIADELLKVRDRKTSYKQIHDTADRIRACILERKSWPLMGSKIWEPTIEIYKELQNGNTDS